MKAISMWVLVQPRKVGFTDESHQWGVEPRVLVQPRKVGFTDESHQWGVEPRVLVQPRKVVFRGESHQWGVEPRVLVQPRKVGFTDESHQWGVEPRVLVQPRKVGFTDESHQWGVEPRVLVQPRKVVFIGRQRASSFRCAQDVVAPEEPSGIGLKKRKAVDTFWKDSEFSRTEVDAAIHITIQEIKASDSGKFRIAEDAKRCLAVALDVFLRTHFHIVSLLAQHRGSQTPKRDDFLLAELLSDEAAVQNSVLRADLEVGTVRKRRRAPQTESENVDWSF